MTPSTRRTNSARVTLVIGGCIAALAGCDLSPQAESADTPPVAAETPAESGVALRDSIRTAALEYVRRETAVRDARVTIEAIAAGWARVTVEPAAGETDAAALYLERSPEVWRAVSIGTAFAPDELDRLGVPTEVRPE